MAMLKLGGRIGILGGTFNPVHLGHLIVAEEARRELKLDKIVFMPAAQPPHKKTANIPAVDHRYRMLALAIKDNPYFAVSDLEARRGGRSYTIDTIRLLAAGSKKKSLRSTF
jgi:nicotinate-nucleotide adenylyltransferase